MQKVVYHAFYVGISALLTEREDYKNRFESLKIENQCILGLAAEIKEL